ncbi:MAG: hypothetical protein PHQ34_04970 [Methanothrix sp.]|nr:hypothetical protein [Methanothrix sp.]
MAACILISAASALGITGAIISQEVSPGQDLDREIIVGNGENESSHNMTAEVLGYATNEGGANIALQPEEDTGPYTARPFLSIDPENFTLGPGEIKTLRLKGTVPDDVTSGGLYASVVILPEPVFDKENNINVVTGFMSLVMLTIKGSNLIKTGEIKNLSASTQEKGVAVDVLFENNGNVEYKPLVTASLEDDQGKILSTKGPIEDRILPTCSRLFRFQIVPEAELSPGEYNITAVAKLSDGTVLDSKETTFTV